MVAHSSLGETKLFGRIWRDAAQPSRSSPFVNTEYHYKQWGDSRHLACPLQPMSGKNGVFHHPGRAYWLCSQVVDNPE